MIKKIVIFYSILALILIAVPVLAKPNFVAVEVGPSSQIITVPPRAVEVSKALYYLGEALDPETDRVVEGYAFIRYKENYAKPPWAGGGNRNKSQCYEFLSREAKWRSLESWLVNPDNNSGLNGSFVFSNLTSDIAKWEDAADGTLDQNYIDILGDGSSVTYPLLADLNSPDGQNEVYFADIENSGAIAITIVWGIFYGPPSQRELLEWDQVYDDVDYQWSASGEPGMMDFENIATHELGHSVGLGDLYETNCSEETMYGYADFGETNKSSLEAGDITGVSKLY